MNWFHENRWLGTFFIVFGISALAALYFLLSAKSGFEAATSQFSEVSAERTRLEHLNPFPNEANFRKMKQDLADYGAALSKTKDELKTQVIPVQPLAPNEFQSHLRQVMIQIGDKARANKVKLPDNFHLGFDEYTAALPNTVAAPLLGQELDQIELLMNILADAHVDGVTALKRTPLPEEKAAAAATSLPAGGRKPAGATPNGLRMLERAIVELDFTASPSSARKVLNQIVSSNQQFFIIRTLHVRDEQEKGPPRETPGSTPSPAGNASTAASGSSSGLKFIVGNDHIEMAAWIEIVRFTY